MKRRMFMMPLCLLATGWNGGLPLHAETQEGHEGDSRWSVTPHVGTNFWYARYDYYPANAENPEAMRTRMGLTTGVELGFEVATRVTLSLGADYALQRFATREPVINGGSASSDLLVTTLKQPNVSRGIVAAGRLWFPLQVGVRVWDGLSLRSGIQLGLTLHGNTAEWRVNHDESLLLIPFDEKGTVKYDFERVHWYVPVGLTYEYRRWVADLRYYYSLKSNSWSEEKEGGEGSRSAPVPAQDSLHGNPTA